MASISRYSDKHIKQKPLINRTNSEERKLNNKDNYINFLETQIDKNLEGSEEKIRSLQEIIMEHDQKFESIIKLVKLLQAFAETQVIINSNKTQKEQENTNIREFIVHQMNERDNQRGLNQTNQCIIELQQAFQEIEKQMKEFEVKVEEHISRASHDILNDFKQIQTQFASPRVDLPALETQLNRKIEIIMGELQQTALQKDIIDIDYRMRTLEQKIDQNQIASYRDPDTIRRDVDDIKMILNQIMNEQSNQKQNYIMSSTPFDLNQMLTKVEYEELERKQNKKFGNAIDRLANLINQLNILKPKSIDQKDHRLIVSNKDLLLRPKSKSKERIDTNQSLDMLPQKMSINKKKSDKSLQHENRRSKSRQQSPFNQGVTVNKLEAHRKTKEDQVKELIRKRKELSPVKKSKKKIMH